MVAYDGRYGAAEGTAISRTVAQHASDGSLALELYPAFVTLVVAHPTTGEPAASWREDGLLVTGDDASKGPWFRLREVLPGGTEEDCRKLAFKVDGDQLKDPKDLEYYSLTARSKGEKALRVQIGTRPRSWIRRMRRTVESGARPKKCLRRLIIARRSVNARNPRRVRRHLRRFRRKSPRGGSC